MIGQLEAAAAACRQSRCPLSLLLVGLDRPKDLALEHGVNGLGKLRAFLETVCRGVDHPCAICFSNGGTGMAVVLPDADRYQAAQLGGQMIERVREVFADGTRNDRPLVSISVGVASVAMPPKNFPAKDLYESADRCLYGSQASGGGVVKSIEIF